MSELWHNVAVHTCAYPVVFSDILKKEVCSPGAFVAQRRRGTPKVIKKIWDYGSYKSAMMKSDLVFEIYEQ